MNKARLELMQAFEHADNQLTKTEKQALATDLEQRIEDWKQ